MRFACVCSMLEVSQYKKWTQSEIQVSCCYEGTSPVAMCARHWHRVDKRSRLQQACGNCQRWERFLYKGVILAVLRDDGSLLESMKKTDGRMVSNPGEEVGFIRERFLATISAVDARLEGRWKAVLGWSCQAVLEIGVTCLAACSLRNL
eukprot:1136898-Pelagomonas_calceolata.AAC.3